MTCPLAVEKGVRTPHKGRTCPAPIPEQPLLPLSGETPLAMPLAG